MVALGGRAEVSRGVLRLGLEGRVEAAVPG